MLITRSSQSGHRYTVSRVSLAALHRPQGRGRLVQPSAHMWNSSSSLSSLCSSHSVQQAALHLLRAASTRSSLCRHSSCSMQLLNHLHSMQQAALQLLRSTPSRNYHCRHSTCSMVSHSCSRAQPLPAVKLKVWGPLTWMVSIQWTTSWHTGSQMTAWLLALRSLRSRGVVMLEGLFSL